eukprot:TRINITY_DN1831_c0_g1_i1.p1 TRINITY_DN1831_c0_g1~~TRINITY_DN1831_c0_g1_i1.p1  ORF type:complete len:505 (+),score=57.34 TRINITY_DN1831_c0_g1_i1:23-1537(+)
MSRLTPHSYFIRRFPSTNKLRQSFVSNQKKISSLLRQVRTKPITSTPQKIIDSQYRVFSRISAFAPFSPANRVSFYFSGDNAFKSMWSAISAARTSIRLDIYHLEGDVAEITRKLLIQKAREGVSVVVTYDVFGSSNLDKNFQSSLEAAGGKVIPFNDPLHFQNPFVRNHRKLLVVDDSVGFLGGMNLTDQFRSEQSGGLGLFRDVHIRVEGSAAKALGHLSSYSAQPSRRTARYYALPRYLRYFKSRFAMTPQSQLPASVSQAECTEETEISTPVAMQIVDSDFLQRRRNIQLALRLLIRSSVNRLYLTSPYFIPTRRLRKELLDAAQRGIDVRIVTAGVNDVGMALFASQYIYRSFLEAGIKIYEYHGPARGETLHSKLAMVDGYTGCVGSFNLDLHSDRNLEVMAIMYSPCVVEKMEAQFQNYLLESKEVTLDCLERRTIWHHVRNAVCYHAVVFTNNFAGPSETPVNPLIRRLRRLVVYMSKISVIWRKLTSVHNSRISS